MDFRPFQCQIASGATLAGHVNDGDAPEWEWARVLKEIGVAQADHVFLQRNLPKLEAKLEFAEATGQSAIMGSMHGTLHPKPYILKLNLSPQSGF